MARPVERLGVGDALSSYRLRARNTSAASENRIHDDTVARQFGFRGGLVPGVTVYAYMTNPVVSAFGIEWLGRGQATVRFRTPIYDGDTIEAAGSISATDEAETVAAVRIGPADAPESAAGQFSLPNGACELPRQPDEYARADLPDERPPATREVLEQRTTLGTVTGVLTSDLRRDYLASVGDELALYDEHRVAHPGEILGFGNTILAMNVALEPWMHVESTVRHFSLLREGEAFEVRGQVADLYERKGHEFVDLDVLVLAGAERPVAQIDHRAIFRIRREQ